MVLALMAGIAACHWTGMPTAGWIVLLAVAAMASGLMLFLGKGKQTILLTTLLTIIFLSIGALRGSLDDPRHNPGHWTHSSNLSAERHTFLTLRLTESPTPRERSWKAVTEVETIDNQHCYGAIRLYLRKDSTAAALRYGDRLLAHGYPDRERGSLYVTSDHYLLLSRDSTSLRARCETLRMKLLGRMQAGSLEHRSRGVAEAMTLGWRGDLEPDLQAQFRDAGIMHLLCVSGLHVGLLAAMAGWLLVWLGKERRGRIIRGAVQLAVIWAFALLTGLAPATVRAGLMFSLFVINNMIGRRTSTLNLLAAAAIAMLVADPMLLFDTGWQLSFSAVAGILLAQPAIALHRNILWQATIVSLAATLATLPITLSTFHQFQPYFLIANVVIVPAASVLLACSLLYMALPCTITAFLARWPIWFCDRLTASISRLPGAVIGGLEPSPWTIALLTVAIATLMITIYVTLSRRKKKQESLP